MSDIGLQAHEVQWAAKVSAWLDGVLAPWSQFHSNLHFRAAAPAVLG